MTKLEKKIAKLNKLAIEIDTWCDSTHPSAWKELNEKRIADYIKLAAEIGRT